MKGVTQMINDLIQAFRAAGIDVPEGTATQVEVTIRQQYRGESIYIAGPSRQVRARQIATLGKMETRKLAAATGLSVRTIRRIRNGK